MAVVSGYNGDVAFATGYATKVDRWDMTFSSAEQDITGFVDAGWRTFIGGVKEWRGTFTAKWDQTKPLFDDAAFTFAGGGFGGAAAEATFSYGATGGTIVGTIVVTEVGAVVAIGDANTCTFTFVGSGVPTAYTAGS
jgi:hypothetical protein